MGIKMPVVKQELLGSHAVRLFRVVAVDKQYVTMSFRVLAESLEAAHEIGVKCAGQSVRVIELSNMQTIGVCGS